MEHVGNAEEKNKKQKNKTHTHTISQNPPASQRGMEVGMCIGMGHVQVTKAEAGSLLVMTSVFGINT